jgi:hypothetical protein
MAKSRMLQGATAAGVLALVLGLTTAPASADRGDLEQRAKCAIVELAMSFGERVSAMDRKACAGRPASSPTQSRQKPFANAEPAVEAPVAHSEPGWLTSIPVKHGVYYGVGSGGDTIAAYQDAVVQVAAQLEIEIHKKIKISVSEKATESVDADGRSRSSSQSQEELSSVSSAIVKGSLKEVKMTGRFIDSNSQHHVLAELDKAAIEQRQQELVEAVLETLSEITEAFVGRQKDEGVLSQNNLRELTLALSEVNALGKMEMGKKQKRQWKPAYRGLQGLVKKMVNCVEAKGHYVLANGSEVPLKSSPMLTQGAKIRLTLSCRGLPIADATMKTYPSGGLVQIPMSFETDGQGQAEIPVGSVLGAGVKLGFTHDLQDVPGAFWLSSVKPSRKSEITFRAGAPATIRFDVQGGTPAENDLVRRELGAFAQRQWGANTVKKGAVLVGKARIRFPTPRKAGGKIAAPIELDVALTLGDGGGVLIDTTVRTAGVGQSKSEAREKALSTLGQKVARLQVKPVMDMSVQVVMPCRMAGVDPEKPKTIQAAVGKCLAFLSGYKKADAESIISNSLIKIESQLGALSSPPGIPSGDEDDQKLMRKGLQTLKKAHKICKKLEARAKRPELLAAVRSACDDNLEAQKRLTGAADALKKAEAEAKAEAARLEAEEKAAARAEERAARAEEKAARAEEKAAFNCEVKCKKASITRNTDSGYWKMMRMTYLECVDSGAEEGCIREAIDFCVRACLR